MDLYDDEVWTDREGNEHEIATMELRHARNVIAFLERNAETIAQLDVLGDLPFPVPSGDVAYNSVMFGVERDDRYDDPLAWLRQTPVMEALSRRVALAEEAKADSRWEDPDGRIVEPQKASQRRCGCGRHVGHVGCSWVCECAP